MPGNKIDHGWGCTKTRKAQNGKIFNVTYHSWSLRRKKNIWGPASNKKKKKGGKGWEKKNKKLIRNTKSGR